MPQPTSTTTPGPSRADDLPVARVVQREQGVRGRALHRPLAGEFHHVLQGPREVLIAFEEPSSGAYRRGPTVSGRQRTANVGIRTPTVRPDGPRRSRLSPLMPDSRARPARRRRPTSIDKLGDLAATAGLRRIAILAWRDLDDPEAGGSELHASRVASLWAEAGIEVTMRTSYAAGHPQVTLAQRLPRDPQGGPLPRVPARRVQRDDGLARRERRPGRDLERHAVLLAGVGARPTVAWLHHVHDSMWEMTLPPKLAKFGRRLEFDVAPRIYRRTPIVTLSNSSKDELVTSCTCRTQRITVVPPGIDPSFSPGGDAFGRRRSSSRSAGSSR